MFNSIILIIKGFLLGGLGGLIVPAAWMTLVFGVQPFLQELTNGTGIIVILTSMISIPFSILFQGLLQGGLIQTMLVGATSGAAMAVLVLILQDRVNKRTISVIAVVAALFAALLMGLTQSAEITLDTGLIGWQIWVLLALYVISFTALAYKLREPSAA